jgi:TetR/AcrR family transcriptional repressor of nem operon
VIARHGTAGVTAASLARHAQTVIQGAFVLAKTQDDEHAAALAREELLHLRRYFELLFITGK